MPTAKVGNQTFFVPQSMADSLGYDPGEGGGNSQAKEAVGLFNAIATALGAKTVKMPTLSDLMNLTGRGPI